MIRDGCPGRSCNQRQGEENTKVMSGAIGWLGDPTTGNLKLRTYCHLQEFPEAQSALLSIPGKQSRHFILSTLLFYIQGS